MQARWFCLHALPILLSAVALSAGSGLASAQSVTSSTGGCPEALPKELKLYAPIAQLQAVAAELEDLILSRAYEHKPTSDPETRQLKDVQIDFGQHYSFRIFTPIEMIPERVVNAFLAAQNDPRISLGQKNKPDPVDCMEIEILRQIFYKAVNPQNSLGMASISSQYVIQTMARDFLRQRYNEIMVPLGIKQKFNRQIVTFLLDRSERVSNRSIFELYLNLTYMGLGSYGVTAAAVNYFGKPLDRLTLAEAAYLAILPKAPSNYHPVRQRERALSRRNWAIDRMLELKFISEDEARSAKAEPLETRAK